MTTNIGSIGMRITALQRERWINELLAAKYPGTDIARFRDPPGIINDPVRDKFLADEFTLRSYPGNVVRFLHEVMVADLHVETLLEPISAGELQAWSCAYWTTEEAVALSLGYDPNTVDWSKLEIHAAKSELVRPYHRRLRLAIKAAELKRMEGTSATTEFLIWAKSLRFKVPQEVSDLARDRNIKVVDEPASLGAIQGASEAYEAQRRTKTQAAKTHTEQANAGKSATVAGPTAEPSPGALELKSLHKLVIGMAITKYRYDPVGKKRSSATKNIADALVKLGMEMSVDTVLTHLRKASKVLLNKENQ